MSPQRLLGRGRVDDWAYKVRDYDTGDCGPTNSPHWFLLTLSVIFFRTLNKSNLLPKLNQTLTVGVAGQRTLV